MLNRYGLYLCCRASPAGVKHFGIIDVAPDGVWLYDCRKGIGLCEERVESAEVLARWSAEWIADQLGARGRLAECARVAAETGIPYDLLVNNCEQLARFVATGQHTSVQLRNAFTLAVLAAIAACG